MKKLYSVTWLNINDTFLKTNVTAYNKIITATSEEEAIGIAMKADDPPQKMRDLVVREIPQSLMKEVLGIE